MALTARSLVHPALLATSAHAGGILGPLIPAVESPPFPLAHAVSDRCIATLRHALRRRDRTYHGLRGCVVECSHALRVSGMSPEATLVTMKAFIRHSAMRPTSDHRPSGEQFTVHPETLDLLLQQIVAWTIEGYFEDLS